MNRATPGPWIAASKPSSVCGWPVVSSAGRLICEVNYIQHTQIDTPVSGDRVFNAESKANARLIAAAPEMLEALKLFVAEWDDGNLRVSAGLAEAITRAIDKAEGRND